MKNKEIKLDIFDLFNIDNNVKVGDKFKIRNLSYYR